MPPLQHGNLIKSSTPASGDQPAERGFYLFQPVDTAQKHRGLRSSEMRHCPTSLNMFTSRWPSESSHAGFNDRFAAGDSSRGGRSLQEVDNKAEVKTICLFKHPLQLITLIQGYAQGDPDRRQKSLISTDEHDLL